MKMYQRILVVLLVTACLIQTAPETHAASFTETFLSGEADGDYFDVYEGWSARFAFNMTTEGETAILFDND